MCEFTPDVFTLRAALTELQLLENKAETCMMTELQLLENKDETCMMTELQLHFYTTSFWG